MHSTFSTAVTPMTMADGRAARVDLQIRLGHSLLLEEHLFEQGCCMKLATGLVRVVISNPDEEALKADTLTLAFLQQGERLTQRYQRAQRHRRGL